MAEIQAGTDPLDPQSVPPATLYVEPDEVCGGEQPCYSTIQAALNVAGDGAMGFCGRGFSASMAG
ncbi:MAG TPA: hypothetical protein HPP90_06210, partial [Deltaproteobacteria bacterium]|nr:hypothetical protein [Deltaproteobacteria bacterium]